MKRPCPSTKNGFENRLDQKDPNRILKIVEYLESDFSEKEVRNFVRQSNEFFELLSDFPEILVRSSGKKGIPRGPMNKHTILTYRVNSGKNQIELINIRPSRKKPLK